MGFAGREVIGTSIASTTNSRGEYELKNVPKDSRISFTMIGMTPLDQPVEGKERIDVTLQTDNADIEEVVVWGMEHRKKLLYLKP